jgi:hypothetical protein
VPYNSYKLNAQAYSIINKVSNIKDKDLGRMHLGLPLVNFRLVKSYLLCRPLEFVSAYMWPIGEMSHT